MILGGTVTGDYKTPAEWEELLVRSRFRAVTAPFNCLDKTEDISEFVKICDRHDVLISEIGVWRNTFKAEEVGYAKRQLKLANDLGIECCVNIAGTISPLAWDAADISNYTSETYSYIVKMIRDIIDSVKPTKAYYCLEPMPWMIPDGPDTYLKLMEDVDREMFAVHMDFVNMINSPRRFLKSLDFIEECMRTLAPYIKSTHIKDSCMDLTGYTTHINECPPGKGELDYPEVLKILDKYLPSKGAILLEHMNTFEAYDEAFEYVLKAASIAGLEVL